MSRWPWRLACLAAVFLSASLQAQTVDQAMSRVLMFGIHRDTGMLVRYDFAQRQAAHVGVLRDRAGSPMLGIDAAAYFPGFQNLYAFWASPADSRNKLVYVDVTTGAASIVADDLEGGRFTGATAVNNAAHPWEVFAVQIAKTKPPLSIAGLININPNNSPQNEFTLRNAAGRTITRDDLHSDSAAVEPDGTYYRGDAVLVHVKPKGNGNQNELVIDGRPFPLQNSNTYDFKGAMQVRVFNDKPRNGRAMGHWWIQIYSGQVTLGDDVQVITPHRIARIDQRTGAVTELMRLSRPYAGLASLDGNTFYTTSEGSLYRIDLTSETETLVGDLSLSRVSSLGFVQPYLMAYDIARTQLGALDAPSARTVGSPANLGLGALGVIVFTPRTQDPVPFAAAFD